MHFLRNGLSAVPQRKKGDLHKKCLFHSEPTQSVTTKDYAKRLFNLYGAWWLPRKIITLAERLMTLAA